MASNAYHLAQAAAGEGRLAAVKWVIGLSPRLVAELSLGEQLMIDVVIRPGGVEDAQALALLVDEVQAKHTANRPELFRPTPLRELETWVRELFQNPSARVWVAEVAGALCGYLVLVVRDQPEGPFTFRRTWIELDQIAVHHTHRRQGIARALVAAGLAYADAAGIRQVELTAWSFNQEAQSAFRKLGFVPKVVRFEWCSAEALDPAPIV